MANRLNLARRPFVETRPVNLALATLGLLAVVLTVSASRTVVQYYSESARTRAVIASLRKEDDGLEERRRMREASLQRYDVAQLAASARDANAIKAMKAFSWTRFFSRLEKTLPPDARVSAIAVSKPEVQVQTGASTEVARKAPDVYPVSLSLISRDAEGLPKLIRTFYASPWFDKPEPVRESGPEGTKGAGWKYDIVVEYHDSGKKG
jgi:hypothetical protein